MVCGDHLPFSLIGSCRVINHSLLSQLFVTCLTIMRHLLPGEHGCARHPCETDACGWPFWCAGVPNSTEVSGHSFSPPKEGSGFIKSHHSVLFPLPVVAPPPRTPTPPVHVVSEMCCKCQSWIQGSSPSKSYFVYCHTLKRKCWNLRESRFLPASDQGVPFHWRLPFI